MTDIENAIRFFENAIDRCVVVARKPFETALAALRRTAEDDKAREEGRLVVLPCKTGRTVYIVDGREINRCIVGNALVRNGLLARKIGTDTHYAVYQEDMDKTVFLTRQDAEAALKGENT